MVNLKKNKKNLISISLAFIIIVVSFNSILANNGGDWFDKLTKIKLGETSRGVVEKLFEVEKASKEDISFEQIEASYNTESGSLRVVYASGKGCSDITNMGYKLKKDIIVSYYFIANKSIKLSRLGNLDDLASSDSDSNNRNVKVYASPKIGRYYISEHENQISIVGQSLTLDKLRKYSCEYFIKQY